MPSDGARQVHWKASAKTAALKTREYAAEETRKVMLLFDRYGEPGDENRFEHLVSEAASLALHLMANGTDFAFATDEWQTGYGRSDALQESILRYLAEVEMSGESGTPPTESTEGALILSLRHASAAKAL